ncbi:MAG: DUF1295 domain-containing protein [Candidatus Woesearchaeota archaeon]|nr:MAG: DUF1295 domain-containing protein [Candidatus Woesearchaeota archaeon]
MDLLIALLLSLGLNIFVFLFAFGLKTDKLTDVTYSLTFVLLLLIAFLESSLTSQRFVLFFMVFLWALRLGSFLFLRIHRMKKDKRFDGMRESFPRFLKFWLLQGLAVWIISLPALLFLSSQSTAVFWFGAVVWLLGFLFESLADYQKLQFMKNPQNKNKFISSGLWRYSRHPNYFGEILCWVGVYLFVLPSLSSLQLVVGLLSPLFIIALLLFVTGIPLLEKKADEKWGSDPSYVSYKKKTRVLLPWFPKS